MASEVRKLILEALESGDQLGIEDIREYVLRWAGPEKPSLRSIGKTLYDMRMDNSVIGKGDTYMLPAPTTNSMVRANSERDTEPLPPYQRGRGGRAITVEHSPLEFGDVARLQIKRMNVWMTVPLFGDVRVCIGPDVPRWSPEQETYDEVSCLKIITKDGKPTEMNLDVRNPLTIAPGIAQ